MILTHAEADVAIAHLRSADIPAEKGDAPPTGPVAILVPPGHLTRARQLLLEIRAPGGEMWVTVTTLLKLEDADGAIARLNNAEIPVGVEVAAGDGGAGEARGRAVAIVVPARRLTEAREILTRD